MDPQVEAALIAGLFSVGPVLVGFWLRRRTRSALVVRRSLDRQEHLENYVFTLRRQINAAGRKPHPWPAALRYLNRDDQDEEGDPDDG